MLVIVGILCGVLVGGEVGQLLTFVLVAFGLGGAVLLVFYEVGLSEDSDRAREQQRRRVARAAPAGKQPPRVRRSRFRRRP
jgi:hypothetical protein